MPVHRFPAGHDARADLGHSSGDGFGADADRIATSSARDLDPSTVKRLSAGAYSVFQLDATAYPGNSGSPLYLAGSGEVVGIINMVFVKSTKEAALSAPSGIAYAVPVQPLAALLERLN